MINESQGSLECSQSIPNNESVFTAAQKAPLTSGMKITTQFIYELPMVREINALEWEILSHILP
jgi:hypothetical protein